MNTRPTLLAGSAATLALWLLAAHLLRGHFVVLASVATLAPLLLLIRAPIGRLLVQAMLVLGSFEWLRTLTLLTAARMATDRPWLRMSLILLAVVAFTLLAAWLLRGRRRELQN